MKRILLLLILAIEGLGGILGGLLLAIAPDGRLMEMPATMMRGVFPDFFIPGLILTGMGILTTTAFLAVYIKSRYDWILSGLALVGFAIWFAVEIAILREVHWLHIVWGTPVLVGIWAALPLIPKDRKLVRMTPRYH